MSRDLCEDCGICSAQEDGLCYYCMETVAVDSDVAPLLEGSA